MHRGHVSHLLHQRARDTARIGEAFGFESHLGLQKTFAQSSGATRFERFFDGRLDRGVEFAGWFTARLGSRGALGGLHRCLAYGRSLVDPLLGFTLDSGGFEILACRSRATGTHGATATFGLITRLTLFELDTSRCDPAIARS